MKKYYYLYEITISNPESSLDGCFYYGKHITSNLNDNYYGSGKIIKSYLKKYGTKGLTKNILSYYTSEEELNEAEKVLIENKKSKLQNKCLNLNDGGHGSFNYINKVLTDEQKHNNAVIGGNANKQRLQDPIVAEQWRNQVKQRHAAMSIEEKTKIYSKVSDSLKKYYQTEEGKKEKEERKIKNKESNKKTATLWRQEFQNIFHAQPESYRKYGKQKEAHILFNKIKNLSIEEQQKEVNNFLKSIEEIV